ncbi:MAG: ABC transporter ATP-binding protein, partial [Alphaproteobacteria bacterium]
FVADRFRDNEIASIPADMAGQSTAVSPERVSGGLPAVIDSISVSTEHAAPFDPLTIDISYTVRDERVDGFLIGVAIKGLDGLHIFGPNTHLERVVVPDARGSHRISYHIPSLPLLSGTYRIDAGLFTDKGLVCLDYVSDAARVTVAAPYFSEGLVYIAHEWKIHED